MSPESTGQRPKCSDEKSTAGGGDEAERPGSVRAGDTSHSHDPRPLKSYAGIMASYGVLTAGLTVLLRSKRFRLRPLSPWNFVLYALAAEHISRLISQGRGHVSCPKSVHRVQRRGW